MRGPRPVAGMVIGTGIHLEPKTVALVLTLKAGGAEVVSTGNLNSTQPEAVNFAGPRPLGNSIALARAR